MQSQKKIRSIYAVLFLFIVISSISQSQVWAKKKEWIVFHDNISQEIQRFNISLEFTHSKSIFYKSYKRNVKSTEIEKGWGKTGYDQKLDFGKAIDGNQYIVLIQDASNLNIISSHTDQMYMANVLRAVGKKKPVTVKEGYFSLHRAIEIPFEVSAEEISVPSKGPVAGTFGISISTNRPHTYESSANTRLKGTLSGSMTTNNISINATITCSDSLALKDRFLHLSIKPFDPQIASLSVKGKISEILMAGSAKLIVEKIASDSSELVLALLHGDLAQKSENIIEVGKPFPAFTRVELLSRRLLALDDLTEQAGVDGYVVLVFGDFKKAMPERFYGRSRIESLTLGEAMIIETLKKGCDKTVVVGFVCQRLSISTMYEKWLGRDLDFYVFSDFSNPLNVQFEIANMEQYNYDRFSMGETLKGQLAFANEKVITVLINGSGDLVYINTDAGKELAGSLVQINKLMKENKKSG